jgi:hypothetical protein
MAFHSPGRALDHLAYLALRKKKAGVKMALRLEETEVVRLMETAPPGLFEEPRCRRKIAGLKKRVRKDCAFRPLLKFYARPVGGFHRADRRIDGLIDIA